MEIEIPLLPAREAPDVQDRRRIDTHALQRGAMGDRRDDQHAAILEADEPAIEQMVDTGVSSRPFSPSNRSSLAQ